MFTSVRYIALLCVIVGSIASCVLAGVFAAKAKDKLYTAKFEEHTVIAHTIASGFWRRYAPLTYPTVMTPQGLVEVRPDSSKFPSESAQYLSQYPSERLRLFALKDGQSYPLAVSNTKTWTTTTGNTVDVSDIESVKKGLATKRSIIAYDASGVAAKLYQSVIPIPRADANGEKVIGCIRAYNATNCAPEVYVEAISDLTAAVKEINVYRWIFSGFAIAMFVVIGSVVIYTVSRAEGIISKQHEVNLELTAAAAAAEAQSRDKSMFLASISHELRTPLNAIIGFSEIIKTEGRGGLMKQHQEYIDDIHGSGKHLLALINDILDYSKAEAGKLQIEYSDADLLKLIRNSMRMVLPRAEGAQVTLVENLPKESIVITTDIKKLKQVLLNLLSNAVKFTPAGGEVRISAWEDVMTKDIIFEVKDTGIGIAPKDISRVMMPFVQVDSALSRRFEGTGLGLPLSKKFVESMGGQFFIESEVNKGTTITARLPAKPDNVPNAVPQDQSHVPST